MNPSKEVLLIGGSMSGRRIFIKRDCNMLRSRKQENFELSMKAEEYVQFGSLEKIFICKNEPIQKINDILHELIFQGLSNGG